MFVKLNLKEIFTIEILFLHCYIHLYSLCTYKNFSRCKNITTRALKYAKNLKSGNCW